jgi:CRISPR system Cascade subunit CasB
MSHNAADRPFVPEYYKALYDFVAGRVSSLQEGYLADTPSSVAALARLRRALTADPGANPEVWAETLKGMPHRYIGRDVHATPHEHAAHAAFCLYALHQQGRGDRMHASGSGLGRVASRLARATGNEAAVRRRFQALATATGLDETLNHARGLITQFRGENIPLDYGLLAVDLDRLQQPERADGVRLKWGRDYYFKADDGRGQPDGGWSDQSTESTTEPGEGR